MSSQDWEVWSVCLYGSYRDLVLFLLLELNATDLVTNAGQRLLIVLDAGSPISRC